LPFSQVGNGDCYCFDYSRKQPDGETPVVIWFHDEGETQDRAKTFAEFVVKAKNGEFEFD
jgi:SMI1-KNR4 cell-wall